MAPKQVYGKRTKTVAASYAKLLSPDKKNLLGNDAAKEKKQPKTKDAIAVVEMEQQLQALTLQEDNNPNHATKDHKRWTDATDATETKEQLATEEHAATPPAPTTPVQTARPKSKNRTKPTSRPKMQQLPTPEPTPDLDDVYAAYVSPLLSISEWGKIVPFEQWSSELDPHFEVTKIAEASFSEVYRLTTKSGKPGFANESVLKVVAIQTPPNAPLPSECRTGHRTRGVADAARQAEKERAQRDKDDEWKSHIEDVHSEVRLLQNLNHIPGFTHFCEVTVLQGRPSALFANAWKSWNKARPRGKKSYFPDPTKKTSFDDTQLWVVIEMQDAGTDCEKLMEAGGVSTVWEVWDVFWGVCLSVAKAEEACRFEHRDLHLENICIRSSRPDSDPTKPTVKEPLKRKLGFTGLETTVIDYTLSRADIVSASRHDPSRRASSSSSTSCMSAASVLSPAHSFGELDVAYLNLNKNVELFNGDAEEEYQYEIYRYMRAAALHGDPLRYDDGEEEPVQHEYTAETPRRSPRKNGKAETALCSSRRPKTDIWKRFHPKTNLVWAHFILYKLMEHLQGHEPSKLSCADVMANVEASTAESQKVYKKAVRLHKVLEKVSAMLEPGVLGKADGLGSMKELVVLAMDLRWLNPEDVAGGAII